MDIQLRWRAFLEEITLSDAKHFLWLCSLSYLEYIAYRKMIKTLGYEGVNRGVFHHLSNEIQHSYMLKELAEKGFEGKYRHVPFDERFIGIAEEYFQKIVREVKNWVFQLAGEERPYLCYLFVSYMIEKRAMMVYLEYYSRLQEASAKMIIQKIIRDGRAHINFLEDKLNFLPETESFKKSYIWDFENEQFFNFLDQFQSSLTERDQASPQSA